MNMAQKWHSFFGTPELHQNFQNYFTVRIRRKRVIILSLKITPHLKCVATLHCDMSSFLKATNENKTTSVTTHFKEINKERRVPKNCAIFGPPCICVKSSVNVISVNMMVREKDKIR